jgi:hypothetical protein
LHKLQKMIDENFELIKSFTTEAFNLLKWFIRIANLFWQFFSPKRTVPFGKYFL